MSAAVVASFIIQLIGFDFVVARDIETDDLVRLAVVDLSPVSLAASTVPSLPDLSKVDDRDGAEARRRLRARVAAALDADGRVSAAAREL